MNIKAVVIDFDGTIVTGDILDVLCHLNGKGEESKEINKAFHQAQFVGIEGLIKRINFLKGLSIADIQNLVSKNDYLQKGALELFKFLKENNIISIIASGNIMPLLEIYKEKLGADYLIGSNPTVKGGRIVSISFEQYSGHGFKKRDLEVLLKKLNIEHDSVVAIGDSPADKGIFELSAKSIAIDPKGDIAKHVDYVIEGDISLAVPILKNLMEN
jgi:phosphoserine phosphatase